jgi:hypothetical protein
MLPLYIITGLAPAILLRYLKTVKLYLRVWNKIVYFRLMQEARLFANLLLLIVFTHTTA